MSINFTSSVFVFLLILVCVNNVFMCLFVFMENKTKMSINILLLLFAVLMSSKSAVSLSQLCVGLVKDVSERGFVNDPLLDIGDFETRLFRVTPSMYLLFTAFFHSCSFSTKSPLPKHQGWISHQGENLDWKGCQHGFRLHDIFRSFWFVLFRSSASCSTPPSCSSWLLPYQPL